MLRLDWILAWVCDLHFVVKTAMLDDRSKNRTIRGNGRHTCSMACHACERWRFHETHSCQLDAFILWNLPCPVQRLKSMGGHTDSGVRRCGQRIYACGQAVFLSVIGFEGRKSQWRGHYLIFDSISEHWIEKNLTFTKYWLSIQWAE